MSLRFAGLFGASFSILCLSSCVDEQEVNSRIRGALVPISQLLAADPSGEAAQQHLQGERLHRALQDFITGVPGAPHEDSPERQARVAKVEDALNVYESSLTELLLTTKAQQRAPNSAMVLIRFAKPTEHLRQALLEVAQSSATPVPNAALAYDALFMLQLDDENLREDVLARIDQRDELHTRAKLANELLASASTNWALRDLEPLYVQFLSTPCRPENYPKRGGRSRLTADYLRAAAGLSRFGLLAGPHAPLCRQRIAELDPQIDDDERVIGDLKECIERLEGKRVPKLAVNVKSQFLGVSSEAYALWKETSADDEVPARERHSTASAIPRPQVPAGSARTEAAPERRGSRWAWLIGGALLLVGLALWIWKRRSRFQARS